MQSINSTIPETWFKYTKDILGMLYLVCGNTNVNYVSKGAMYDPDTRLSGVPVNGIKHYKASGTITFDETDGIIADSPTAIGNFLSDDTLCILPNTPTHDVFTDLLYSMYLGVLKDDYPMAFVSLQCFMLMSKMASSRLPMTGGLPQTIEVTPYEL